MRNWQGFGRSWVDAFARQVSLPSLNPAEAATNFHVAVYVNLGDVGLEQIRVGMAWHYKEYQHEQTTHDRIVYRDEEESAKPQRVGLWKDPKPVPPWEWRGR